MAWMFRSKWFKIKVHIDKINCNTSSILIKVIMSSQNNMAKESLSLQNHIVKLCFIFITQSIPIMHNPGFSQEIGSYFLARFSLFQLSHNTWAWDMDIALWMEWNIMIGIMWENHKGESLTLLRLINGLWRCPSIDVNVRSRDCHATDALEL